MCDLYVREHIYFMFITPLNVGEKMFNLYNKIINAKTMFK